jgi:RNA polymerase sigma-70 factor (ECF subfamily)
MDLSDEEWMQRLARRDDNLALQALMDRYRGILVNHFARRGVKEAYEDLAQETFVRIYKARKRYRDQGTFRAWMFRIAQRVWIDHVRKSARRLRKEQALRAEPVLRSRDPRPMLSEDLQWALEKLKPSHREVVMFSVLEQLTHQEVAAILEIPEGTVKSRLYHALRQLREILNQEDPTHD